MSELSDLDADLEQQAQRYDDLGFNHVAGFGSRPALLIIDMQECITKDVDSPLYIDMTSEIPKINQLAEAFRQKQLPVALTVTFYTPPHFQDAGAFGRKLPLLAGMGRDTPGAQIDRDIGRAPSDLVIDKKFPSGFYGTHLQSLLTSQQVDTVVITGNSTSGCCRATAVDAVSGGFNVVVASDGVADRAPLGHRASLADIHAKYGDVMPTADILVSLKSL